MSPSPIEPATTRRRREPPVFRRLTVNRVEPLTARLLAVTLAGPELAGLVVDQPAASVRLLLPSRPATELVVPSWHGNEFLLPDGQRPMIRTFTPTLCTAECLELELRIVTHGSGVASEWAASAKPGDPVAISGPGRGYAVDLDATAYLVAGDETAIPAISQLLQALPDGAAIDVHIEVGGPDARLVLPHHPGASIAWIDLPAGAPPGDALVAAVRGADLTPGTRAWIAGEAAAVHRIRRHLFEDRGMPRSQATVRGYWKYGRRGDDEG